MANFARRMPSAFGHIDSCATVLACWKAEGRSYGVLNAAGPALSPGPAKLTFRRKETTDVDHHVDRYDCRDNGNHGDGPHTAAPSSKVAVKPRPGNRSWHLLNLTTFRISAQARVSTK
jgi:hypothetical protein